MQTIAIRLDPTTRHNLEQISRVTGVSRSDLVMEAVRVFVDAQVRELVEKGLLVLESDEDGSSQDRWNIIV